MAQRKRRRVGASRQCELLMQEQLGNLGSQGKLLWEEAKHVLEIQMITEMWTPTHD